MQSESFLEAETPLFAPLWCCHVPRLVPLALDWQCKGRFFVSLSRLPDCLLNDYKFLYFHCSCVCCICVLFMSVGACVWVCMHVWRPGIILFSSSILSIEAGCLSKTSLAFQFILGNPRPLPLEAGIAGGLPCPVAFTWVSEDLSSGSHVWVVLALISFTAEPLPQPQVFVFALSQFLISNMPFYPTSLPSCFGP